MEAEGLGDVCVRCAKALRMPRGAVELPEGFDRERFMEAARRVAKTDRLRREAEVQRWLERMRGHETPKAPRVRGNRRSKWMDLLEIPE